jgi:hypothetical protein
MLAQVRRSPLRRHDEAKAAPCDPQIRAIGWDDEIDLRGMPRDNPRACLSFTLEGDCDGQWTVEMRVLADHFHPIRFERRQG